MEMQKKDLYLIGFAEKEPTLPRKPDLIEIDIQAYNTSLDESVK